MKSIYGKGSCVKAVSKKYKLPVELKKEIDRIEGERLGLSEKEYAVPLSSDSESDDPPCFKEYDSESDKPEIYITCVCGVKLKPASVYHHKTSKRHQKYMSRGQEEKR